MVPLPTGDLSIPTAGVFPQPASVSEVSDALRERVRRLGAERPPRPEPAVFRLMESDLDHEVPPDFHGARLLPAVADALCTRSVSLLLAGPNGVGKTRQAWAMVRASRRSRLGALFTAGEAIKHEWQTGRGWCLPIDRATWAARAIGRDTVWLISEVGDVRRHPFDFTWIDRPARFSSWLVVDDIGASPPTPWVLDALYLLANERRGWKRPTVWTTHHPPERLRDVLGPAIASRLLGGLVLSLDGPDRRLEPASTEEDLIVGVLADALRGELKVGLGDVARLAMSAQRIDSSRIASLALLKWAKTDPRATRILRHALGQVGRPPHD